MLFEQADGYGAAADISKLRSTQASTRQTCPFVRDSRTILAIESAMQLVDNHTVVQRVVSNAAEAPIDTAMQYVAASSVHWHVFWQTGPQLLGT